MEILKTKVKKDPNTVIQFRCSKDIHDEFMNLSEEYGQGNAPFMSHMINCVKLNATKSNNIDLVGDINSLESHVSSIQSIFLNVIDKLEGQKKGITQSSADSNKIYVEKIADLQIQLENFKVSNVTDSKLFDEQYNKYKVLTADYDKILETLKDKTEIAADHKEKNILLTAENLKLKENETELDLCKKELETIKAEKIEQLNELTKNTAEISNLKNEKLNLIKDHKLEIEKIDKQVIEQKTFSNQKMQLAYDNKLFDQKLLQQNICDTKLKDQQKIFDDKENLSDKRNKDNSNDFYRRQNKFGDDLKDAYNKVDEVKAEFNAYIKKTSKGKNSKDSKDPKGATPPLTQILQTEITIQ